VSDSSWLWAVFTIIAAAAQTVRNAAQRELTSTLGTVGATHVRFLFGCPFALVILACVLVSGAALPRPGVDFWPWVLAGALMQIAATALMLAAMGERSFVVAIAYIKTEPIQVALFGLMFLGDRVTLGMAAAIVIATGGVIVMSLKGGPAAGGSRATIFALSAIGFRGAILILHDPDYLMAATFTMATGLVTQATLLSLYLALRDRAVLAAIAKSWRPSLFAGFMGATASQFWFLAFALATAASVRTLALVEVLFAQAISRFVFRQKVSRREGIGIVMIVIGVVLLVWSY
jgi:drug/metabolite transporter (DMT)-like permease